MLIWIELLLCLAVIAFAGYFLSRYGDIFSWRLFSHAH
jgi:hypothetical protein